MRGKAMSIICDRLKLQGVGMHSFSALEFFAREGDWQTIAYYNEVRCLEAWEIDSKFIPQLKLNLPHAIIRNVDSYAYGRITKDRFDFIVIDNPQSLFGSENSYCEHFEALPIALNLLKPHGFLIFNINWQPFNFNNTEWKLRRCSFYGIQDTSVLSIDKFMMPFYSNFFNSFGYNVINKFSQNRNCQYLAYAVFALERL